MPWRRVGSCPPSRCQGHCCTHIGIWFNDQKADIRDFLKLAQVRGLSVLGKDGDYLLDVPHRCQYLTDQNLCGLHPDLNPPRALPTRPEFCNSWPTEPSQLLNDENCGFSFVWIGDEEQIDVHS